MAGAGDAGAGESRVLQSDVVVRSESIEKDAREILALVKPAWRWADVACTHFDEGITNKLVGFRLMSDVDYRDMVLMRIYGANTDIVINRNDEKRNMMLLHSIGCAPPLYACFGNGLAYGFVRGSPVDRDLVRDPVISELICEEMAKMHSIPLDAVERDGSRRHPTLFEKMRGFLSHFPESYEDPEKQEMFVARIRPKEVLLDELSQLEEAVTKLDCRVVFCHNDLLCNNIIYDRKEGRIAFIDYEYGSLNYDAYDIGNHFCEYAGVEDADFSLYPDRTYQIAWIRKYLRCRKAHHGRDDVEDDDSVQKMCTAVNKFALCSHFFWGLWCLIQAKYSLIEFDYLGYGVKRFGEYFSRKEEFLSR